MSESSCEEQQQEMEVIHFGGDLSTPSKLPRKVKPQLEWWRFAFIIYFLTCGGGFGSELIIKTGGIAVTFALLLIIPFLWSVPILVVVSELGSAFPSNAGVFNWVLQAFGLAPAYVTALLYWANYIFSTSLYPVLFLAYLGNLNDFFGDDSVQFAVGLLLVVVVMFFNILGVEYLGKYLSMSLYLQLIPFIIIFLWSLFKDKIRVVHWITSDLHKNHANLDYMLCMQMVIWSFSGYESVGSLVEEIKDSQNTLARALCLANVLSVCIYIFSFLGPLGVDSEVSNWDVGYFQEVAALVGGHPLKQFMTFVAMISTLGSFNALLFTTSQQLAALGDKNFLDIPMLSHRHSTYNTPTVALAVNSMIFFAIINLFSFNFILKMNNLFYGFIVLLICFCMLYLRFTRRDLLRPLVLIESNTALAIFLTAPCLLSLFCIANALHSSTTGTQVFLFAFFIGAIALLLLTKEKERYKTINI